MCQVVGAHLELFDIQSQMTEWRKRSCRQRMWLGTRWNVGSIIHVDKEKGWAKDASLGYPSSNWEGLGGSTSNDDLQRSVGNVLGEPMWRLPPTPYDDSL